MLNYFLQPRGITWACSTSLTYGVAFHSPPWLYTPFPHPPHTQNGCWDVALAVRCCVSSLTPVHHQHHFSLQWKNHTYLRQTRSRSGRAVVKRRSCSIHAWNTAECTWSLFTYPTRGKFVYNFWTGLIEILSSCRPHPTQTNTTPNLSPQHLYHSGFGCWFNCRIDLRFKKLSLAFFTWKKNERF